jgi:cysteine desulfurase family protein
MQNIIYLDNASTTFPKPNVMHDAMSRFYRTCGINPGRTGCEMALKAEEMVTGTRRRLSRLFNPGLENKDPSRLVFTHNATDSLNIIINGTIRPGDHVVITALEHNSVFRPINHLVNHGAEAAFVNPGGEGYVDPEEIRKAIGENTKLVIVNHASNVIGTVQDIKGIGAVCKEAGVPFAVDAAQTAGVLPIDMHECNISFLAFTGHKGLFGPTGTGGICVADDAEIATSKFGGTGKDSCGDLHPEEYPHRLEAGTINLMGIAGLAAALDWLEEEGMENIHRREIELLGMLQDGFKDIKGVTILGTTRLENRVAVCSITIEGYSPAEAGKILDNKYNILVRTGIHCAPLLHRLMKTAPSGTVRFSIGAFNTEEHINAAIRAVAEIAISHT